MRLICTIMLLGISYLMTSQDELHRETISSGGKTEVSSEMILTHTIGEVAILDSELPSMHLHEGFEQSTETIDLASCPGDFNFDPADISGIFHQWPRWLHPRA